MSLFSEHYEEELFDEAEERANEYLAKKPFDFEGEIIKKIEPDANRIINGMTIREACSLRHNTLHQLELDPRYHDIARAYWGRYCYGIAEIVNQKKPSRHLHLTDFPSLEYSI